MCHAADPARLSAGSAGLVVALAVLAGCGPVSVQQAEAQCMDRAALAERPRGHAAIGIGTGGFRASHLGVEISSDYVQGRDPSEVYNTCVYQRSGQYPTRPFYSRDEWRG